MYIYFFELTIIGYDCHMKDTDENMSRNYGSEIVIEIKNSVLIDREIRNHISRKKTDLKTLSNAIRSIILSIDFFQ